MLKKRDVMNTQQLFYFITVADTLNFTKAAKKCFISQTAMSLQIKALEKNVGVPLFKRDRHHVELTAAGQVYLREARQILKRSDEAIKLAQSAAEGTSGSIRIGYVRGYEKSNFSLTLRGFRKMYPHISIELVPDNMNALYRRLENDQCDIIFDLSPYMQKFPSFEHRFLKEHPMMGVLSSDHPLAKKEHLMYKDLADEDFVVLQPKDRSNNEAEEVAICHQRGGFVPKIVQREPDCETLLLMVAADFGVAILPEYSVRPYADYQNLSVSYLYKENGEKETLPFEVCWSKENENPAIGKLLEYLDNNQVEE